MPKELLRQGKVREALEKLQGQIRAEPANSKLRVFLFQLLCIGGQWERALTQLNLACEMDAENLLMAQVCRPAIQCEVLRQDVFAGKRQPLIFGEPAEWLGWMVQANMLTATGKLADGVALRAKAFEAAPPTSGTIDGKPYEWIADADGRLGPILEAIIEGRYFWVPFTAVKQIDIEEPKDLRDVVWTPAHFQWTNGGEAVGFIPTRYSGSESSDNPAIQLARLTDWVHKGDDLSCGLGQRLWATDEGEYPILQSRQIAQK